MRKQKSVKLWGSNTSTILSISLVLFVLGLLSLLVFHSYKYTNDIQEGVVYNVILSPEVSDSCVVELQKQLQNPQKFPYVKSVYYISKDEAASNFAEELGEDFVEFMGYNPLFPSLEVTLKSSFLHNDNEQHRKQFVENLQRTQYVTDVVYQENMVNDLSNIFSKMGWFLALIIVLLLFVSVMLINCTIKISIYSKRHTIKTMQLVGAKRSFIISPFIRRSILYGFLGGLVAIVLLVIFAYIVNNQFGMGIVFSENMIYYLCMSLGIMLFGIIISLFSTYLSIVHYLRIKNDRLN